MRKLVWSTRTLVWLALLCALSAPAFGYQQPATKEDINSVIDLVVSLMSGGATFANIVTDPVFAFVLTSAVVGFATKWITNSVKYGSKIRGWHTRLLAGCIAAVVSALLTYLTAGQLMPDAATWQLIANGAGAAFLGWFSADTHARNKALGKRGRKVDRGVPGDAVVAPGLPPADPEGARSDLQEGAEVVSGLAQVLATTVGIPAPVAAMIFPFLAQNAVRLLETARTRPLTGPEMKQLLRATQTARLQAAKNLRGDDDPDEEIPPKPANRPAQKLPVDEGNSAPVTVTRGEPNV